VKVKFPHQELQVRPQSKPQSKPQNAYFSSAMDVSVNGCLCPPARAADPRSCSFSLVAQHHGLAGGRTDVPVAQPFAPPVVSPCACELSSFLTALQQVILCPNCQCQLVTVPGAPIITCGVCR
jgi:hypothetical protein